jgi:hypothetical protein
MYDEDRLKDIKLEDGAEGVEQLTKPVDEISEHFKNLPRKHINIVVQRPLTGESESLVGHRNSDQPTPVLPSRFRLPLASHSN